MTPYENSTPYYSGASALEEVNAVFRKVYQYMAIGLILTAFTAYFTASSQAMLRMFFSSGTPVIIVAAAEIGLVFYLSASLSKIAASTARTLFFVYSILNGITCSAVLLVYTSQSVYTAFMSTAGMFGAMSLYGLYTKRDLTGMGSFLTMGLIGLIAAMLVNMFMGSTTMELAISILGVMIFLGLTAYDTARIKAMASSYEGTDSETAGKVAVIGALALYLDFINIFLYILRFVGHERR